MSTNVLLESPVVVSLATWVWGDAESEASASVCLKGFPFWMPMACWSQLVVKGLGVGIILGSCLNKLPIIRNILSSHSAVGLSRPSVYGEIVVYANCALYGLLEHHPFSAYGENVAVCTQSIVIMLLIWRYTQHPSVIGWQERFLVIAIFLLYVVGVIFFLPTDFYYLLMASIWPVMIYSRGSQILETWNIQHTGAQSVITMGSSLVGSSIRIFTTIQEVGWDMAVLTGYLLSVFLNSFMCMQYIFYRKNTERFLRDLQEQRRKKQQ